ncbi:MAG: hypothetical protein QM516_11990, partial [Limnohabitans sp.]|nr:hypothetical protein [Limnohabitans sp.]
MLLPLVAVGLWVGSALIDSTGWTSWRFRSVLTDIAGPLCVTSVCSCLVVGLCCFGVWLLRCRFSNIQPTT